MAAHKSSVVVFVPVDGIVSGRGVGEVVVVVGYFHCFCWLLYVVVMRVAFVVW